MRTKVLPFYWLFGVIVTALNGLRPSHYARLDPESFVYQTDTVLIVIGLMTVQTLLLMGTYRPATYADSWGRALLALLVSFGFMVLGVIGAMHAPPAWAGYTLWLLVHFLAALGLAWNSALGAFRNRTR
jgi:hypothetical protein